ncbi:hypothetical protein E0500_023220 [Streptomyces sp. KM273126]|uniref:hypothetical protein n=1 Tax=Streptomyces sp. KM273126 TaxID=2545247 RepID=UPI001405363B|nr:hypothetical protein [Streptomyces sp. KM273126]MBA2810225.1 hypothetical protein [Streptomyces sp. KM273126]
MTARFLLARPVQDPLGDHELLPLGLDLLQLLGQLRSELVQFAQPSRDPLQLPHPHALPSFPDVPAR